MLYYNPVYVCFPRPSRQRALALVVMLLAAQVLAVHHVSAHALGGDPGTCRVCHVADGFKHGALPHAAALPVLSACPGAELPRFAPVRTIPIRAYPARAPPLAH